MADGGALSKISVAAEVAQQMAVGDVRNTRLIIESYLNERATKHAAGRAAAISMFYRYVRVTRGKSVLFTELNLIVIYATFTFC